MTFDLRLLGRIFQVIFAVFLILFAVRLFLYHFNLVTYPFPNSLREGAMMTSTDALVHGHNPYNMALQPQYTNTYGIGYPLLVWPWAKLFGTTMLVHRTVTAVSILAACVLIFFVLKRMAVPLLLNLWASLMLYASLLYPGTSTPTVDPGASGTLFFLATVFLPWFCRYSLSSLIVSIIFGILAYYTKSYCALGIPVMASFLFLFVSKRKGLFYGFAWLVLMVPSIIVVSRTCQAYFDNCFFAMFNSSPAWSTAERLYMQIHLYSTLHSMTLALIAVFILGYAWQAIRYWRIKKMGLAWPSINIKNLNEPLIQLAFPLWAYAGICSCIVLYVSLGRHNGATLWYFFQLLSPFFLVGAVWLFSRSSLWFLCIPFLIYNLYFLTLEEDYKRFKQDVSDWREISSLIDGHVHILNSSLITPLLVEKNKPVVDNGASEAFGEGGDRTGLFKTFFQPDLRVPYQLTLFFYTIRKRVEKKQYDLIILQPSLLPLGVGDDIKKYYKYEGELWLNVPQDKRPYAVSFWKPL